MQAGRNRRLAGVSGDAGFNGGVGALLTCGVLLSACATDQRQWLDQTTLVIRPSHHEAVFAYSFGGEEQRQEPSGAVVGRNIAATIAAAAVVRDDGPLPSMDSMDFKGGRLLIHPPKNR